MNNNDKIDIDTKKPDTVNNEFSGDIKVSGITAVIPTKSTADEIVNVPEVKPDMSITNTEFGVAIVKCVTGTGCLSLPFAIVQMGIIPTIIVFFLVTCAMVINTRYLLQSNEGVSKRVMKVKDGNKIDNDYANLMFQLYGKSGYNVFLFFFFATVWGVLLGTMIGMFTFIKSLPYPDSFLGGKTVRDLILHIITTAICVVLCCIRNTKQLFFVSWFGIFALLLSYIVVVIYGLVTISVKFDSNLLWSKGAKGLFASIGVAPYALGYNFVFLTYYKQVRKNEQSKTFGKTVSIIFLVCITYLVFAVATTIIYGSARDGNGNMIIQDNIISNLPSKSAWGVIINALMWLSCVCSLPVLLNSANEVLEAQCKETPNAFFISDMKRFWMRFAQIGVISFIAYVFPFFKDIIGLFGGLAFVATNIFIPVIIHYSVFKSTLSVNQKWIHSFLALAAGALMVVATFFSAQSIINSMSK